MSENNYLFRGKAIRNGKWVEGNYVFCDKSLIEMCKGRDRHIIVNPANQSQETEVDPATIGQWSGLYGTSFPGRCKIFAGDKVLTREPARMTRRDGAHIYSSTGPPYIKEIESTVVFHMGAFRLRRQDGDQVHMTPLDFYFDEPYRDRLKDAFLVREHEKWSDILQGLLDKHSLDDQDALIEHLEEVVVIGNVHEKLK